MRKYLDELDGEWLTADGFDGAMIGVSGEKVVYSTDKCIEILKSEHGMSEEEAIEYFDFNVQGAYVGEKTPKILVFSYLKLSPFK